RARIEASLVEAPGHVGPRSLSLDPPAGTPSLARADALGLATLRLGSVHPSTCELDGRLRAEYFIGAISDGVPNLVRRFRPDALPDRPDEPVGGAVVEFRVVVHRWPRAGDLITVRSGLAGFTDKVFQLVHWVLDAERGDAVASAAGIAVSFNLKTRKLVPIAEETRAHLQGMTIAGLAL
ncbi:MAG: thioesterase, partial [Alphaproteobacteria bacterium]|nr:thioesterase [Alphaproteobacteria bacterium]